MSVIRALGWTGACGVAGAAAAATSWLGASTWVAGVVFAILLAIGQTGVLRTALPSLRWYDLPVATGIVAPLAGPLLAAGHGLWADRTGRASVVGVAAVGVGLGLLVGLAQWSVLRHHARGAWGWMAAILVGGCLGAVGFAELWWAGPPTARTWILAGMFGGACFGVPAATVLPAMSPWVDPSRLAGKTVVITGGNRGLGRAVAEAALAGGARVILLCRRPADAWRVVRRSGGDGRVFACDLRNPESVAWAGQEVVDRVGRVDILVHTAGCVPRELRRNAEGIEETLAVHAAGPILLTERLRPALASSRDPRVVFLVGPSHRRGIVDPEDLGWVRRAWERLNVNAAAQAARMHATRTLARRLAGDGVTVVSVHPGAVRTGMLSAAPWWARLLAATVLRPAFVRPSVGALPVLAAMVDGDVPNGGWRRRFTAEPVAVPREIGDRLVERVLECEIGPGAMRAR